VTEAAPDPAVDPRAEAVRSFGRYLLRERELRGLSLEDVVRVTRLTTAVIESIESGDPVRMPPRGYLVGYLRSYAGAVGLDPDDVVLRFQEAAGLEDPEPATPRPPAPSSGPRRRLLLVVVGVALAVAVALGIAARRGGREQGELRGRRSTERAPYRAPGAP
jgi:cytoskeletal protein RodZ